MSKEMNHSDRSPWPQHLVLFREPSETNVEVLTRILGARESGRGGVKGIRRLLQLRGDREGHFLERTGVAVVSLTEDEVEKVRREPGVVVVDNNARRRSRTVKPATAATATNADRERLIAYLRGIRDTSESLLRFIEAGSGAPRVPDLTEPMIRALSLGSGVTWALQALKLPQSSYTGRGVTVAVLDTGVDLTHPDLAQHFADPASSTATFVPGTDSAQDTSGHGTHCAGIIAARATPQAGPRYSIAPNVTLIAAKVLDDDKPVSDAIVVEGIEWAWQMGANILSLSLGKPRTPGAPPSQLYASLGATLAANGILLVGAAGNESHRPMMVAPIDDPAVCEPFAAVAAVDEEQKVGWFSCGNSDGVGALTFAAPGVAVHSAWIQGGYSDDTGTSVAAPHVAGVAALWAEKTGERGAALRARVASNALPIGPVSDVGRGLVQAPGA
jgi:subtilisin family serine protease